MRWRLLKSAHTGSSVLLRQTRMQLTIYHNPHCSKSRQALELIRETGAEPAVVEYLSAPPDAATLLRLASMLELRVSDLLRTGETEFKEAHDLPPLDDDAALADWIVRHPHVLQRPIVSDGNRAIVGRPPENVLDLL